MATGLVRLLDLVGSLVAGEFLEPGYYRDPDWTVRDVVAHLGTWLAEAQVQFERINAGTYGGHDVDIDALNAAFLEAMVGQPWDVAWVQANAARTMDARRGTRCANPATRRRGGCARAPPSTSGSISVACGNGRRS